MLVLIGGLIVFPFLGYWLFTVILATGGYKKPNQDKWIHSWQAKATTVTLLLAAALPVAFMAVPETWRPLWRWLAVLSLTVVFVYEAIFVIELNEGGHPGFKEEEEEEEEETYGRLEGDQGDHFTDDFKAQTPV